MGLVKLQGDLSLQDKLQPVPASMSQSPLCQDLPFHLILPLCCPARHSHEAEEFSHGLQEKILTLKSTVQSKVDSTDESTVESKVKSTLQSTGEIIV